MRARLMRPGPAPATGLRTAMVVEDDSFVRGMLTAALPTIGLFVVASCASVSDAISSARRYRPTLAIVDLDLGRGPTGVDLAYGLREIDPGIAIVVLTAYEEPRFAGSNRPLPDCVEYVVKRSLRDLTVLRESVERACSSLEVAKGEVPAPLSRIDVTDTRAEIMRLVAAGCSNADIGERMSLTERSVEKAIQRIVQQFGIRATPDRNQRVLIANAYRRMSGAAGVIHP